MTRSTPDGEHLPVMSTQILMRLDPKPGGVFVDGTLGHGGHAELVLEKIGPTGKLFAFDLDREQAEKTRERLARFGDSLIMTPNNFAGAAAVLAEHDISGVDGVLADLGMSSMQVDEPARGFSFAREGPLDMRMDPSRGKSAADLVATLSADELAEAFAEYGDEPNARVIARAIVRERELAKINTTTELAALIQWAAPVEVEQGPNKGKARQQLLRPTARVFQALRILVNREMANLEAFLRSLPYMLKPGGVACVLSFHSGEDRRVKAHFRDGVRLGLYSEASDEAEKAGWAEAYQNPRSRSAKLRWGWRALPEND